MCVCVCGVCVLKEWGGGWGLTNAAIRYIFVLFFFIITSLEVSLILQLIDWLMAWYLHLSGVKKYGIIVPMSVNIYIRNNSCRHIYGTPIVNKHDTLTTHLQWLYVMSNWIAICNIGRVCSIVSSKLSEAHVNGLTWWGFHGLRSNQFTHII